METKKTALDSIHALFDLTRGILKAHTINSESSGLATTGSGRYRFWFP